MQTRRKKRKGGEGFVNGILHDWNEGLLQCLEWISIRGGKVLFRKRYVRKEVK